MACGATLPAPTPTPPSPYPDLYSAMRARTPALYRLAERRIRREFAAILREERRA
ncbi:MAG: hypothetical protein ACREC5_05325 [Thermoplasmata archaeon]